MTIETWEQVGTLVERDLQNQRDRKPVSYDDFLAAVTAPKNNQPSRWITDPKVFAAIKNDAKKVILDTLKAKKR